MKSKAVIDLGYGDSGKGIVTARLCEADEYASVVRFSGGCQAAHNVITDDGRHHTFAQFGSGTFSRTPTYLSKYMLFEPFALQEEAQALAGMGIPDPLKNLLTIAWDAYITTPYHWELNQWMEELRGDGRHGSTGRGVGATAWFASEHPSIAPRAYDLMFPVALRNKLGALRKWVRALGVPELNLPFLDDLMEDYGPFAEKLNIVGTDYLEKLLTGNKPLVFEGSQGVLLDEDFGFFPYVTRTLTTDANILKLYGSLNMDAREHVENIGVIRSYTTRHGNGPFVGESNNLDLPELHNTAGHWMGDWRVGYLDLPSIQYAMKAMGDRIDGLYVTHTDTWDRTQGVVSHYTLDGEMWEPEILDRHNFIARSYQSEALKHVAGVITHIDTENPAQTFSEMLRVPLYGSGHGPKISEGSFMPGLVFSGS